MRKSIRSQAGFSLIELMVVVAIIGILASIGIPQMAKFQARARQSEAKAHLSTIYTAEQSFQSEWSTFSVDLKNIGASATGTNLRYDGGFDTAAACAGYPAAGAPAEVLANRIMSVNAPANTTYYTNGVSVAATVAGVGVGAGAGLLVSGCSTTAFSARVWGQPNNAAVAAGTYDVWGINENKLIANTNNGIL